MDFHTDELDIPVVGWRTDRLPQTIADRTRRTYDRLAFCYHFSTFFFHSRAHQCAVEASGIQDGMRVLEAATGSGEMFRRLVRANPTGETHGFDLSPNMAARTQRQIRQQFPSAKTLCGAVDARHMPFDDGSFDVVMCCYLLELLGSEDIAATLREFRRVLRPGSRLTLVLIGQNTDFFNRVYRLAGSVAPAFWGRQVEHHVPSMLESGGFRIEDERAVRQSFYPSKVLVATR